MSSVAVGSLFSVVGGRARRGRRSTGTSSVRSVISAPDHAQRRRRVPVLGHLRDLRRGARLRRHHRLGEVRHGGRQQRCRGRRRGRSLPQRRGLSAEGARRDPRASCIEYIHETLSQDWPAMRAGGQPSNTSPDTREHDVDGAEASRPTNFRESNAQAASIQNVQSIFDTRRLRLLQNQPAVPAVLWFALVVGAITIMTFYVPVRRPEPADATPS